MLEGKGGRIQSIPVATNTRGRPIRFERVITHGSELEPPPAVRSVASGTSEPPSIDKVPPPGVEGRLTSISPEQRDRFYNSDPDSEAILSPSAASASKYD